jgi:hypothetical protein
MQVLLRVDTDLAHLHGTFALPGIHTSMEDALVRDKAHAEVVLAETADDQLDDESSPWNKITINRVNDDLDDVQKGPEDEAADEHLDETVDQLYVLFQDTSKTIRRHEGDYEVQDSDNEEDDKGT